MGRAGELAAPKRLARVERRLERPVVERRDDGDVMLAPDALELMDAVVREPDALAGDRIAHGARDEDLAGRAEPHDPRARVHGVTADLAAHDLGLAEVEPRPDLEAELTDPLGHLDRTADRVGGPGERGEEPVTRRVEHTAVVALERPTDEPVVRSDEGSPPLVAHPARDLGGRDDVGEEHGDELGRHARARHARGGVSHGLVPHKTRVRGDGRGVP